MDASVSQLGGYRILGRLAVGGMAEVYQASALPQTTKSPGEPDEVALKRLLPSLAVDEAQTALFVDEARLMVRLRHPHIVRTYRCFKSGEDFFIVQELIVGRSLGFMQSQFVKATTPMPASASVYVTWCLLGALDYLHSARVGEKGANIVHRDVSPANVLLSVAGEVKLTDFGVSEVEGVSRGEKGALRGTIAYMSPEAVLGMAVDHRTDLFAAGVVLWELLANRRLYDGSSDLDVMHKVRDCKAAPVRKYNLAVPEPLERVVRKALFADRAQRFSTAAEFRRALEVVAHRQGWPLTVEALTPLLA